MRWAEVSAGYIFTVARAIDGSIWSWGINETANDGGGQLGLGDTENRVVPNQIGTDIDWNRISCGEYHTLALKTDNTLWDWGGNFAGQLGFGDLLFDNWEPFSVGTATNWAGITGGYTHSITQKTDGTIWTCGWNNLGQLGLGASVVSRTTFTQIGTDSDWLMVAAGGAPSGLISAYSLALKTNRTFWSWGVNNYNQLGLGDAISRTTPALINSETDWSMITAGWDHSIVLKNNGTIWSFGSNFYSELGCGDTIRRSTPASIGTSSDWSLIAAGAYYSMAIKTNGALWSWGLNIDGQLGLGNTANKSLSEYQFTGIIAR